MDALEALLTRRSIRAFRSEPVDPALLHRVLGAALHGPSAGNQQPWRFVVIDDPQILRLLALDHPHASVLQACPVAILVCAETVDLHHPDHWPSDCAAATFSLMLAAHALGLGSTWIGLHPQQDRMAALRGAALLPPEVEPFALVPLGHPAERTDQPDREHPEWIRHNTYLQPWGSGQG